MDRTRRRPRYVIVAWAALSLALFLLTAGAPAGAGDDAPVVRPEDHALSYLSALGVDTDKLGHVPFVRELGRKLLAGEVSAAAGMTLSYLGDQALGKVPGLGQAYQAIQSGKSLGVWMRDKQRRTSLRNMQALYTKLVGSGPTDWKTLKTSVDQGLWEATKSSSDGRWVLDAVKKAHPAAGDKLVEYMAWKLIAGQSAVDAGCRELGLDPESATPEDVRARAQARIAARFEAQAERARRDAARRARERAAAEQAEADARAAQEAAHADKPAAELEAQLDKLPPLPPTAADPQPQPQPDPTPPATEPAPDAGTPDAPTPPAVDDPAAPESPLAVHVTRTSATAQDTSFRIVAVNRSKRTLRQLSSRIQPLRQGAGGHGGGAPPSDVVPGGTYTFNAHASGDVGGLVLSLRSGGELLWEHVVHVQHKPAAVSQAPSGPDSPPSSPVGDAMALHFRGATTGYTNNSFENSYEATIDVWILAGGRVRVRIAPRRTSRYRFKDCDPPHGHAFQFPGFLTELTGTWDGRRLDARAKGTLPSGLPCGSTLKAELRDGKLGGQFVGWVTRVCSEWDSAAERLRGVRSRLTDECGFGITPVSGSR